MTLMALKGRYLLRFVAGVAIATTVGLVTQMVPAAGQENDSPTSISSGAPPSEKAAPPSEKAAPPNDKAAPNYQPVPTYDGAALYAANCANCHGSFGEGDGIVTPSLAVVLLDLRYLAERNDGEFPRTFIHEVVDGRAMRAAHGPQGMPIWGAEFARSEGFDAAAEARVSAKIDALILYLQSIQISGSD